MRLVQRYPGTRSTFRQDEYFCDLTTELDKLLAGASDLYRVYILDTRDRFDPNIMSLRVPGSTVGHIEVEVVNDKLIIVDAVIAQYAVRRFNDAPNEVIKQFIGQQIQFPVVDIIEEDNTK